MESTTKTNWQKPLLFAVIIYCIVLFMGAYKLLIDLPTTPLEFWIFVTGVLSVWLAVKAHVLNWPIGIVNVLLWLALFLQQHLFANAGLQIFYIVTGFLGWYWWSKQKDGSVLQIAKAPKNIAIWLGLACLVLTYPATIYLKSIGGAATYWDGLTTLLSLAGQYLLMKKYIENWWFWIVADVIYITLFFSQSLFLSSQLYLIFMIMCIFGLKEWKAGKENQNV